MSNSEHTFKSVSNPHGLNYFLLRVFLGLLIGFWDCKFSGFLVAVNLSKIPMMRVPNFSMTWYRYSVWSSKDFSPKFAVTAFPDLSKGLFNCLRSGYVECRATAWLSWSWCALQGNRLHLFGSAKSSWELASSSAWQQALTVAGVCMCVFKSFISLSLSRCKPLPVVLQATSGCTQQDK